MPHLFAELYPTLGRPGRALLTGRLVYEDQPVDPTHAVPWDQITEDECKRCPFSLHLPDRVFHLQTDEEGYFQLDLAQVAPLPPGLHLARAFSLGERAVELGQAPVRVLPQEGGVPVVISDIDLTYLITPFQSTRGKLRLLQQDARQRQAFAGMPQIYQGLRQDLSPQRDAPLVLLSGSPRFFKRVLEGRLQLDQIQHDALLLKGFKDIAWKQVLGLAPHRIKAALSEQVAYKLMHLLVHRLSLPPRTPELLLGDDSEADFVTYALYRDILYGSVALEAWLLPQLVELRVPAATHQGLLEGALQARDHVQQRGQVLAIGIRRTGAKPAHDPRPWIERTGALYHKDSLELAQALHLRGLLEEQGLRRVQAACARGE